MMRTKLKDRLLDWLSQGQQIGLKASWPAQFQLKGRVERLASKEKEGRSVLAWSILLLSLVFTAVLGCVYYQNSDGIKAPLTQGEARIIFQRGIEQGLELSPDFQKAVQMLGPVDPSIPSHFPLEKEGLWIAQPFGPALHEFTENVILHRGLDLVVPKGEPVFAMGSGTIIRNNYHRTYGNIIAIDHGNGLVSQYAHLDTREELERGEAVEQGQQIGTLGNTGLSSGPHLHVEIGFKATLDHETIYFKDLDPGAFLTSEGKPLDHLNLTIETGEDIREVYQRYIELLKISTSLTLRATKSSFLFSAKDTTISYREKP
jgi:murein DD-endopeptidase MepM/ murein hydrolase activator NlpD